MSHAERCPVCYGIGIVNRQRPGDSVIEYNVTCHGCKGLGWVEVSGKADKPSEDTTDDDFQVKTETELEMRKLLFRRHRN